ncbi:MAG TPA: helix-turn-helix domain-containing protein [Acetobacteraceae bacterium]|nr:helix-turn-helix domain-containing protein [Acetobacteraceae bacterium]
MAFKESRISAGWPFFQPSEHGVYAVVITQSGQEIMSVGRSMKSINLSAKVQRRRGATSSGGAPTPEIIQSEALQPPRALVWLSSRQAAARSGYSVRTLKRWIAAGYLSASRTLSPQGMGHLRIRLGDLESFMASGALA